MPEKIEIDLYQFITRELEKLEARMDRRFDEQNSQFKELKEEIRWPRRIAIAGVITTVLAVGFAIIGFKS
ncbi:hypothetical protein AGMMS49944_22930 [Spirochaetia bacterium]|nr:hypothetical protein AGMMS49944_22930 [Spirochaetia bacterium]